MEGGTPGTTNVPSARPVPGYEVSAPSGAARYAEMMWPLQSTGTATGAPSVMNVIAAVTGLGTVVVLRDEITCPAGYSYPDLRSTKTSSGKGGVKLVCRDAEGHEQDGSVFAGLFALLGAAVIGFAGSSAIWRSFGPRAPLAPPVPAAGSADLETPTDRRERRKERKRAEHRDRQR